MTTITDLVALRYEAHEIGGAGRAPLLVVPPRHRHQPDAGFCTVCGGVWPCSRAADSPG
jgi:hypothetical protein